MQHRILSYLREATREVKIMNDIPFSNNIEETSFLRLNVVNLSLLVLKEHVIKQDQFGYGYLSTTVDLVVELLVHSRRGMALPIPMELMAIFSMADDQLKKTKDNKTKPADIKAYTRTYVELWCRLYRYIELRFDCYMAEYIMVEAYNRISTKKFPHSKIRN